MCRQIEVFVRRSNTSLGQTVRQVVGSDGSTGGSDSLTGLWVRQSDMSLGQTVRQVVGSDNSIGRWVRRFDRWVRQSDRSLLRFHYCKCYFYVSNFPEHLWTFANTKDHRLAVKNELTTLFRRRPYKDHVLRGNWHAMATLSDVSMSRSLPLHVSYLLAVRPFVHPHGFLPWFTPSLCGYMYHFCTSFPLIRLSTNLIHTISCMSVVNCHSLLSQEFFCGLRYSCIKDDSHVRLHKHCVCTKLSYIILFSSCHPYKGQNVVIIRERGPQ